MSNVAYTMSNTGTFSMIRALTQVLGPVADGANAPSHSWSNDDKSGMFLAAPNAIGFAVHGAEIARMASNMVVSLASNLNVAGEIVATGDVTAFSDARLKYDVRPIDRALDRVCAIDGVTFLRSSNNLTTSYKRCMGVIAQDAENAVPELVTTHDDGFKSFAYGNMTALLIEAVKEMRQEFQHEIERLERLLGQESDKT